MADHSKHTQPGEGYTLGCLVKMYGRPCRRPIHSAPDHDDVSVCLMHSRDPNKSDADFQKEFEAILEEAKSKAADGNNYAFADFMAFVFPTANYGLRTFEVKC